MFPGFRPASPAAHCTFLLLPQARKEGNADVASRLERALSAAWAVKQATMRPELQLLNGLVRAESDAARRQVRGKETGRGHSLRKCCVERLGGEWWGGGGLVGPCLGCVRLHSTA